MVIKNLKNAQLNTEIAIATLNIKILKINI